MLPSACANVAILRLRLSTPRRRTQARAEPRQLLDVGQAAAAAAAHSRARDATQGRDDQAAARLRHRQAGLDAQGDEDAQVEGEAGGEARARGGRDGRGSAVPAGRRADAAQPQGGRRARRGQHRGADQGRGLPLRRLVAAALPQRRDGH
eukprot:scaffold95375_cov36-Phaeocystis_antarctica.AAC.3